MTDRIGKRVSFRARLQPLGPIFILALLFFQGRGAAEGQELPKPALKAIPLEGATITIDGLLDEPIWKSAEVVTGFLEMVPLDRAPALAPSFVRVAYDQNNLYIAADLEDPEPALVYGDERQRDAAFDRSDSFGVLIDTYHDHQTGFFFETNPLSALSDALISQDGGTVEQNWDGLWEVAARRTERGWAVEFRIPFSTLRFQAGASQIWGIQFRRRVPHLKEVSFWSPVARDQNPYQLSLAGHLIEMEASHQDRRFSIKPYGKGSYQLNRTDLRDAWDVDYDVGGDLRYKFRTNLTLDLTYNTDFAETEADLFQINLTRFPLFFPEKREFFLEGSNFFDFGLPGRLQPFFSRRIGLARGEAIPILGGGKLTGKVGPYGIGALLMETDAETTLGLPRERFGVVRLRRDLGVRSNIGLIATDQAPQGSLGSQTIGFDTTLAPNAHFTADGFWARSGGETEAAPGQAHYEELKWSDPVWRINLHHLRVDEQFDPKVGFVQQTDLDESYGYIDFRPQPATGPVREYGFKTEMTYQMETDSAFLYRSNYQRAQVSFRSGDFILFSLDPQRERLPVNFEIHPGVIVPAGTYHFTQYNLYFNTDVRRPYSGVASVAWGGLYGGDKLTLNLNLTAAPSEGFNVGVGLERDWVNLPVGEFTAQVLNGDVAWSVTNQLFFRGLVQWDKDAHIVAANLRLWWEYREGSRLYFIVNPSHQGDENTVLILTKLTWLWQPF
ncbi:MAG: carbohydrate binding family 9 domain-containing protein [Nitrospirae bacterium]|nr:carbohydrate binding family 9 domain-containing protein [Candidatus Manganitrophaceae bacterium]